MHVIQAGDRDITSLQAAISQKLCTQKWEEFTPKVQTARQADRKKNMELQSSAKSSKLGGMLILKDFGWENKLGHKN